MGKPSQEVGLDGLRNQALTLKFRLLSIQFALIRSGDECNGDVSPAIVVRRRKSQPLIDSPRLGNLGFQAQR